MTARKTGRLAGIYIVIVFVISAFLWGFYLGSKSEAGATGSATTTYEIIGAGQNRTTEKIDFDQFWEVWQTVRERHVDRPVDEKEMFYGAMSGVVASLGDPYSVFLDPQTTKDFTEELSGKFEGIGAEIGIKNDQLRIIAPLPESPAERAGLLAGDDILAVDGIDTSFMTLDEAVRRIRGDKGSIVKLLIGREGLEAPKEFPITRDTIRIISVRTETMTSPEGKTLGVIRVTHFNGDTLERFRGAVAEVRAAGAEGLILDLRNNPGGFLDAAVRMLGEWVPGEVVVSERFSDDSRRDNVASGSGRLADMETVVLVNGGSASASEIMAGALQDYGKAAVIGTQTFGKGSVQDLVSFDDGSSVKLTVAEWLTPSGHNINEAGITPGHVVERTEEDHNNDIDPQMDAAKAFFDGVIPESPEDDGREE